MSKKLIQRDSISGLFQQTDLPAGAWSVNELQSRAEAAQEQLNESNKGTWEDQSVNSKAYGDSMSKQPRPTDYSSKGADRFGVSVTPGEQSAKKAPRSNSNVSK